MNVSDLMDVEVKIEQGNEITVDGFFTTFNNTSSGRAVCGIHFSFSTFTAVSSTADAVSA